MILACPVCACLVDDGTGYCMRCKTKMELEYNAQPEKRSSEEARSTNTASLDSVSRAAHARRFVKGDKKSGGSCRVVISELAAHIIPTQTQPCDDSGKVWIGNGAGISSKDDGDIQESLPLEPRKEAGHKQKPHAKNNGLGTRKRNKSKGDI